MTTDFAGNHARSMRQVYLAVVLVFLALPIVLVLGSAFSAGNILTFPPQGFSLKWFMLLAKHPEFLDALLISLTVSVVATIASLAIGTAASIAIARYRFTGRSWIELLLSTPLILPPIILGTALLMAFLPLGLDRTTAGLILGHVVITTPYVVRMVAATLLSIPVDFEEIARVLGANPARTFYHVTLPMLSQSLIGATVFSMIISFDEFTVSLFLTGPGMKTLPIQLYDYVDFNIDPLVAAVGSLLIGLTVVSMIAIEKSLGVRRAFRI